MNYYLQDSGANNWQLGVTPYGDLTTAPVGAVSIPTLVLKDLAGNYWVLGVTTDGVLTTTGTSPATVTTINLQDGATYFWNVQITIFGQLETFFLSGNILPEDMTPGSEFVWC
jgi:hypothetical protein